ncbi:MAG: hypothetical protein Q4P18_00375 [Methanobrevibacter sp.]|uniref:hypothetical protein n=1 Tax=Methanobrevibacter sp. TaxID=66852 RepID=UPI0026E0EEA0|nr:hypothetical protein [Methanobrevibacter sp.]MDO5847978.1 hypothetical protein [Methanobrevibacter sp.]
MEKWKNLNKVLNIILLIWGVLTVYFFVSHNMGLFRESGFFFLIVLGTVILLFDWSFKDEKNPQSLTCLLHNDVGQYVIRWGVYICGLVCIGFFGGSLGALIYWALIWVDYGLISPSERAVFELEGKRRKDSLIVVIMYLLYLYSIVYEMLMAL